MLLVLVFTIGAIFICNWVFRWSRSIFKKLPPGPIGLPFVGYLPFIDVKHPYKTFNELRDKYGDCYSLYLGSVFTVILSDYELIRDALKRDVFTSRAPLYLTHGIMHGYGLICAEGNLWRDQRKLILDILKSIGMSKMSENRINLEQRISYGVQECIKKFDEYQNGQYARPQKILYETIGNTINDIIFGVKFDENDTDWCLIKYLQEEGVKYLSVAGVVNFLPYLRFLPNQRKVIKFLLSGKKRQHKIYENIIERVKREIGNETNDSSDDDNINRNSTILELYLREIERRSMKNSENLVYCSHDQLLHLLADLFGASLDTTLVTISWCLLFIARDQEVQEKLHKEMVTALSVAPTLSDIGRLPYLRACIAEAQRIRSVVPTGIPHGNSEESHIGGYLIPKNSMVVPLQWAVHMDPRLWPNPEHYDPMRFITIDHGQVTFSIPPYFIPFQTGKRICLGEELAKMLLHLYVGQIVYHFQMELIDAANLNLDGNCGLTLAPPDYELILTRRSNLS